jgi:hypothetical protein
MRAADFFEFARKRHAIYLNRTAGHPEPWGNEDPILRTYRFTNVFRELDRTTLWYREHVRSNLETASEQTQVMGTILFRTLNRIQTGEVIFNQERLGDDKTPVAWAYLAGDMSIGELEAYMRAHCPAPWVTGAYIVKTPDGMDKLAGALWIVEEARKRVPATLLERPPESGLQWLHRALQSYPYIGGFTGYEIVSDLRHLPILRKAQDITGPLGWAHAGPGAVRGLNRVMGNQLRSGMSQSVALHLMRQLLEASRDPKHWPSGWPVWEMREVEHTLCEFDKYERVRLGEGTPRGRFR